MGSDRSVPELASSTMRRSLRPASGLVLFAYIAAHLVNHALGLIAILYGGRLVFDPSA